MAITSTAATAGNVLDAGTSDPDITVVTDNNGQILPAGRLGGGNILLPALLGLAIVAAVASGGGS
ncbi:hypothetical protein N9741_00170 [Octadecabacter sp.]|nr:hypothetical protein [Octadecabacter sp.]